MNRLMSAACALIVSAATLYAPVLSAAPLKNVGCSAEAMGLRSQHSRQSTHVQFRNRSQQTRWVYWLDFHGKRVLYKKLKPGQSYRQQTYLTHPWVITGTNNGQCLAIFMPEAQTGQAILR